MGKTFLQINQISQSVNIKLNQPHFQAKHLLLTRLNNANSNLAKPNYQCNRTNISS